MKQQKQKKEEYKVECTITIKGHEKKCYPFKGTKKECWLYMYSIGVDMYTTYRRPGTLQYFFSLSRFDDCGLLFMTMERSMNYVLRLKLFYKIVIND